MGERKNTVTEWVMEGLGYDIAKIWQPESQCCRATRRPARKPDPKHSQHGATTMVKLSRQVHFCIIVNEEVKETISQLFAQTDVYKHRLSVQQTYV